MLVSLTHIQEGQLRSLIIPLGAHAGNLFGEISERNYQALHENIAFELTKGFQQRERTSQKETGPCRDRFVSAASVRVCLCACLNVSSSGHGLTTIALWMI